MRLTVLGSFPKIPAGSGPSVRTALNRFERREIGPRALEETFRAVTRQTLSLFSRAGLDSVTDGQIRWGDLTDPLCRDVDNLVAGGLQRYFDNNFYYRHPIVVGRLQWQGGALAEWTRQAAAIADRPLKVAIPGPLTVWALSEDQSYADRETLLADLVEVLSLEAESVVASGAAEVQWDEPALAAGLVPEVDLARSVLTDLLTHDLGAPQSVALSFGPASPWLDLLAALPAARVYLDLASDPKALRRLETERLPWEVGLGLLDARDVRLEPLAETVAQVEAVAAHQGSDRVWLHPNAGLEFLPPDRASAKVLHLAAVRRACEGSAVQPTEGGSIHA